MRKWLVIFVIIVIGCGSSNQSTVVEAPQPIPSSFLEVHADVAFTPAQRTIMQNGMAKIAAATHGILYVNMIFDFDFSDMDSISFHRHDNAMLIIHDMNMIVADIDIKEKAHVRAYTTVDDPRRTFIIAERSFGEFFEHDVIHEALHISGALKHVRSPNALMSRASTNTTCFHYEDAVLFCDTFRCDPGSIKTCTDDSFPAASEMNNETNGAILLDEMKSDGY